MYLFLPPPPLPFPPKKSSQSSGTGGKMGSNVFKLLRKSTERRHPQHGSVKARTRSMGDGGGGGKAQLSSDETGQRLRVARRDERVVVVGCRACIHTYTHTHIRIVPLSCYDVTIVFVSWPYPHIIT